MKHLDMHQHSNMRTGGSVASALPVHPSSSSRCWICKSHPLRTTVQHNFILVFFFNLHMKIWNNWKDEFEWNKFKFLIAGPKKSKKMGKKTFDWWALKIGEWKWWWNSRLCPLAAGTGKGCGERERWPPHSFIAGTLMRRSDPAKQVGVGRSLVAHFSAARWFLPLNGAGNVPFILCTCSSVHSSVSGWKYFIDLLLSWAKIREKCCEDSKFAKFLKMFA